MSYIIRAKTRFLGIVFSKCFSRLLFLRLFRGNSEFATFLGYKSPQEWADVKGFLDSFVADKSKEAVSSAYWDVMNKMIASTAKVTWKKKSGGTIDATLIMVPVAYEGHLFAIHFVSSASQ